MSVDHIFQTLKLHHAHITLFICVAPMTSVRPLQASTVQKVRKVTSSVGLRLQIEKKAQGQTKNPTHSYIHLTKITNGSICSIYFVFVCFLSAMLLTLADVVVAVVAGGGGGGGGDGAQVWTLKCEGRRRLGLATFAATKHD